MVVFAIITFLCDRKKLGAQQRCYEFSFIIPPFFLAVLDWPRSSSSTMILSSWLIILEISAAEDVAMTDPDPQALMDWTQRRLLFVQNQNERERFFSPKKKILCQSVSLCVWWWVPVSAFCQSNQPPRPRGHFSQSARILACCCSHLTISQTRCILFFEKRENRTI